MTTSKRVAKEAAKTLPSKTASAKTKEFAGSALSQAGGRKGK